jgi:hypothetical protein
MHKISYLNQIYSIQKEETRSTLSRKRKPDQLYPERGHQINSIQKEETRSTLSRKRKPDQLYPER